MDASTVYVTWERWLAFHRLQGAFLARWGDLACGWMAGCEGRAARLLGLATVTSWPLLAADPLGAWHGAARWADRLEDESRNLVQSWLLTDAELRDWGGRFARALDGG